MPEGGKAAGQAQGSGRRLRGVIYLVRSFLLFAYFGPAPPADKLGRNSSVKKQNPKRANKNKAEMAGKRCPKIKEEDCRAELPDVIDLQVFLMAI